MAFIYLIFIVAAAISAVAAYFSLVGLGSIFAATFWGVVIMGASLEVGKIVTAKWIHANWRNPSAPWHFRGLLCFFVACLMCITSLGIYGYLSKGHLEQQAPLAGLGIQVAQLETQLKQKQDENVRLEGRLSQISKITDKVLEGNAKAGLRASNASKKEAADIQKSIDANNQTINEITQKLVPLKVQTGNVEGELGVSKYIAEAFGWNPDKAIRIIIALIMAAFDPLAISMFIMGSISLQKRKEARQSENLIPVLESDPETSVTLEEAIDHMENLYDYIPETVRDIREESKDEVEEAISESEVEADSTNNVIDELEEIIDVLEKRIKAIDDREEHVRELEDQYVALNNEQQKLLAELDAQHELLSEKKETLATDIDDNKDLLAKVGELEEIERILERDRAGVEEAFSKLMVEESRLRDERELLTSWDEQLKAQQEAINNWTPVDNRSAKAKIIDMLDKNPEVLTEIISVVDAMRPQPKPGL